MKPFITHRTDGKYIREWLVLGPFFPDDLDRDFLAYEGGEASVKPRESDTITTEAGAKLAWKRHESKENVVDLLEAVGTYEHATAYAFCILQSEVAGEAEIHLGNDDGLEAGTKFGACLPAKIFRGGIVFAVEDAEGIGNAHLRDRSPEYLDGFGRSHFRRPVHADLELIHLRPEPDLADRLGHPIVLFGHGDPDRRVPVESGSAL